MAESAPRPAHLDGGIPRCLFDRFVEAPRLEHTLSVCGSSAEPASKAPLAGNGSGLKHEALQEGKLIAEALVVDLLSQYSRRITSEWARRRIVVSDGLRQTAWLRHFDTPAEACALPLSTTIHITAICIHHDDRHGVNEVAAIRVGRAQARTEVSSLIATLFEHFLPPHRRAVPRAMRRWPSGSPAGQSRGLRDARRQGKPQEPLLGRQRLDRRARWRAR
eukprot:scaffold33992_cov31-Tisochrysis_lutea.AAC.1